MTALIVIASVIAYLAGSVLCARVVASHHYQKWLDSCAGDMKRWKYLYPTREAWLRENNFRGSMECTDAVAVSILMAIFWPVHMPLWLIKQHGNLPHLFIPELARHEREQHEAEDLRAKAKQLRADAQMLDDTPVAACGLRDLADEYEQMAKRKEARQ